MVPTVSSSGDSGLPLVAVDVRMWRHSGIGRYIREVVPRVAQQVPGVRWRLVGPSPGEWRHGIAGAEDFTCTWPVYSWREHCAELPGTSRADVRWVPHYNVTPGGHAQLMVTVHDLLPLRFMNSGRERLRAWVFRAYLRRIRRVAALVCVNSQFTAGELAASGGVQTERIHVTPLGVDAARFGTPTSPEDANAGFVFLGNLKPHKNLGTLLAAWERVAPQAPGRLFIVGQRDGFFTTDTQCQRAFQHLGERVDFTGTINDHALGGLLRQATALVLPSLYEGFGLPVLEAMAVGCPVIAAAAGALPEVGGDAALYFPPLDASALAEAMLRVARDSVLRKQLRQAGLARAARFNWDDTAELTAQALRKVLPQS